MKTNEIIASLRYCQLSQHTDCWGCPANIGGSGCLDALHKDAADTIEAQQKRIEELENELRIASLCYTCARNGTKCHVDTPVKEPDVRCGGYEWRGATDNNVGDKEIDAKPLTAFLTPIDAYKGLKRKFLVFKSDTGEMVENCFVLRPDKDPAAVEALRTYAGATDNATLSADIVNWVGAGEEHRWIPVTERLPEEHKSVVPGLGMVSKPVLVTWVDPFSKKAYPDNSFVREGITRNGEFTLNHINGDLVAVAWMPQPKPYGPPKEGA